MESQTLTKAPSSGSNLCNDHVAVGLLTLCLAMAFFEPYALRIRHSVMSFYHPERARERTIWLYNHILRGRYGLLRYLRRQLRRIGGAPGSGSPERFSCFDWMRAR